MSDPTPIYFPPPYNRPITNTVPVHNRFGTTVLMKVRSAVPEKFIVHPKFCSIRSAQTIDVRITLREGCSVNGEDFVIDVRRPQVDTTDMGPSGLMEAWDASARLERVPLRCVAAEPSSGGAGRISYGEPKAAGTNGTGGSSNRNPPRRDAAPSSSRGGVAGPEAAGGSTPVGLHSVARHAPVPGTAGSSTASTAAASPHHGGSPANVEADAAHTTQRLEKARQELIAATADARRQRDTGDDAAAALKAVGLAEQRYAEAVAALGAPLKTSVPLGVAVMTTLLAYLAGAFLHTAATMDAKEAASV
jgi:hypothetical protein